MGARHLVACTYGMLVERLDREGRSTFDGMLDALDPQHAPSGPDVAALLAVGMEVG